jgi:hypothetical protein
MRRGRDGHASPASRGLTVADAAAPRGDEVRPRRRAGRTHAPGTPAAPGALRRQIGPPGRRPAEALLREEQQCHQCAECEAADVRPVRDTSGAHMAERAHAAEQLQDEPHPQHDDRRERDERDDEEEDQREDVPAREHHEVRAEDAGDGPGRAQVRHDAVRTDRDLRGARDDPGRQIEEGIAEPPEPVLDVVSEDPEEPHVPEDVEPPGVQERRGEDREDPAFVPAVLGQELLESAGEPRILEDVAPRDRRPRRGAAMGEVREMRRLPRDLRMAEEKRGRAVRGVGSRREDRFPEEERREVQGDDAEGHPREPAGGVVIPKRKHPPLAFGSREPSEPKEVRDARLDLDATRHERAEE